MSYKVQPEPRVLPSSNKDKSKYDMEQELSSDYLDIWEINPSYKDINLKIFITRVVFLTILFFFLSISAYLLTSNFYFSLGLGCFTICFFIFAFSDNFFSPRNLWSYFFHRYIHIDPFENLEFWRISEDPASILIMNKKDSISTAIRIFEVKSLPENIHPTLNQFLKALNKGKIQYTYQVVQNPILDFSNNSSEDGFQVELVRNQKLNSQENSFQTSIYFSVYHSINGILTKTRLTNLIEIVQDFSREFKSNFSANFHHTKVSLLTENDLINAIRTSFCKTSTQPKNKELNHFETHSNLLKAIIKTCCLSFFIIYLSFILIIFKFSVIIVIIINFSLEIFIIFIWWRELIYYFSKKSICRKTGMTTINPFIDVKFFQMRRMRDVIFAYIDNQLLLALKIFNLYSAVLPTLTYLDKFIRGIGNHKINFNYNLQVVPVSADPFPRECSKLFNERTMESLEGILYITLDKPDAKFVKYPKIEFEKWLDMRSGIWRTMLTISTSSYLYTNNLKLESLIELDKKLSVNSRVMKRTFEDNFLNFKLVELKNQCLISGFISECLKNHLFRLNGTNLNYVYFQGKNLIELVKIANEFKKGIDTRIAAEFNTPLHLKNFITIGKTINTEYLEEEIPLGFTFNQVKQLLITNGIPTYREHTKMKIVSELVKSNIPCVIFDYNGNWSKLIHLFKDTPLHDRFLHFKLGSSFSIDIKNSGIRYDTNNVDYLNLFYDVFALAFKEQKRNINILKETISKNDELDLSSITFDLQVKQKWERPYNSNSMLLMFKDFTDQSQIFSNKALEYEEDINPLDFLKNDKTIIIDLSILKDLEKKTFISFVIMAKFIHYIENSENYYKKIILLPHVDMFFDSFYIDSNPGTANYGKIDKFIAPLLERGFGLIFSCNQIRYLHPHVFNYFHDIITFKTADSRDLAVLKNRMNLQELHGTGYYSSKRNNTYQIDYLMNMQDAEIIVKRSDVYQPFPGKVKLGNLATVLPFSHNQIINYMDTQGYELKLTEQKLLNRAKKTIFEKDLSHYSGFIDEIIHFLKTISSIDNIGNLNKLTLKRELLKYIGPKAAKKVQNNAHIKEIRDELFDILVKHGYLVENHPKRASGSETLRTSYAVGSQYQKALQDYFEAKKNVTADITVDVIEKNIPTDSKILKLFKETTSKVIIDKERYQKILFAHHSKLFSNCFQIYFYIGKRSFVHSFKIGKNIIPSFFIDLHDEYLQERGSSIPEIKDFTFFLNYITKNELLPFSKKELQHYLRKNEIICSDNGNIEKKSADLYDLILEFQRKLYNFQLIFPK